MCESFTKIHIGSACETAFSFPLSDWVLSQWVMWSYCAWSALETPLARLSAMLWGSLPFAEVLVPGREWLHIQIEMCLSVLPDFPYTSQALRGKQIDISQFSQHTAGTLTTYNFPASLWKWYQKRIRLFFHKINIYFLVFCFYIWCTG